MRKLLFLFTICLAPLIKAQETPKLVVGIVVDQMRQDYLFRYQDKFGEGGFKRLIEQGQYYKNAHYNYVPTYTAPGHASIYTGTTPSNHGIISNAWFDKATGRITYCVSDPTVEAVGGSKQAGKMSPRNLKSSTVTDELRLTTNFRSKVVGLSIKDRGAILPAGHNPTGAYWFDSKTGNFMTSTYYMEDLPEWVATFNEQKLVAKYLQNTWEPLYPISEYVQSTADSVLHESAFRGQEAAVFPYDLPELIKKNGIGLIRTTPYGNSLMTDLAIASIEGESLGTDDFTDFLAISFSSTDYIGHAFGPNSIEIEDTYLRLDRELKRIFDYLDSKMKDEYVVFLTADHGVVRVPAYLEEQKMAGGYVDQTTFKQEISAKLKERFGAGEWVANVSNDQIFLNHDLVRIYELEPSVVRNYLKSIVLAKDHVARVYTADEMVLGNSTDPVKVRLENGFNQKMSGDVLITLQSGYLPNAGGAKVGTTHGSGYTYDTHIPIIFYGKGIKKGVSIREVSITDIAPSLSMLLNVALPSSNTGKPLEELFDYD